MCYASLLQSYLKIRVLLAYHLAADEIDNPTRLGARDATTVEDVIESCIEVTPHGEYVVRRREAGEIGAGGDQRGAVALAELLHDRAGGDAHRDGAVTTNEPARQVGAWGTYPRDGTLSSNRDFFCRAAALTSMYGSSCS